MILYSIIMFAVAALLIVLSILIYRGRTELIHDYHRTNVTDDKAYGRAMGKALSVLALPLIAAGIAALFTESLLPTAILLIGFAVAFIPLLVAQKKYNGGLF